MAGLPTAQPGEDFIRAPLTPSGGPADWLDGRGQPRAADKMRKLAQHTEDCRSLLPESEQMQDLRTQRQREQHHQDRMLKSQGLGGFGLPDSDNRVVASRNKIAALTKEIDRLQAIYDERAGRWQKSGHVLRAVEDWLASGIPGGCSLIEVDDVEIKDILKKNETVATALDRVQRRQRELVADRHRVRSACFPSKDAKAKAIAQINALADAGAPYVEGLIEHMGEITFSEKQRTIMVYNVDKPGAVAIDNPPDAIGLVAWLCRDMLVAKIGEAIDAVADDGAALSERDRQVQEAEIATDLLDIERQEASLVWQLAAENSNVWFRPDTNPLAILGLRLETAPRAMPSGTSPMHAGEAVLASRR